MSVVLLFLLLTSALSTLSAQTVVHGTLLDPSGMPVSGAQVEVSSIVAQGGQTVTAQDGSFRLRLPTSGKYTFQAEAVGFEPLTRTVVLGSNFELVLRFLVVSGGNQSVVVSTNVSKIDIVSPDPSQKVMVQEEILDANPGRPGPPISIPGLPIETASGGIKAPQYFSPGVAGDHGEPIAQYIAVGGFLVPNNLSANAHGNGYADPNIYVSGTLGGVSTDGGSYNVLEGNHALNLAAIYLPRPSLNRLLTLTGDYRDIDLTAGLAPSDPSKKEWLALEANYGNGLMLTLEHRQQYKWNAYKVIEAGGHEITLSNIGYYGQSHEGNLVPIGYGVQVNDTVDPRQMDQTHSFILAANDQRHATSNDEEAFSAYFRTYNLALFSNFGEGLIRQSEFRTIEGGEAREMHTFAPRLQAMVGVLYNEDDIHNDNLDHYLAPDQKNYGPFVKVLSNNINIREVAPYSSVRADLGQHIHFYGGLRGDSIEMVNQDKMKQQYSFQEWRSFLSPKATVAWSPGNGPVRWLPSASFSIGQAFFTEDPRITVAPSASGMGVAVFANPFERSHSEQLALEKIIGATEFRLLLGRVTTTATLAKIDPDNGSADDEGPSTNKFLTASVRHKFSFGSLQGIVSKADARLQGFNGTSGSVVPEAPRTIFDILAALDYLPFGLKGRAEYEYVGRKFLDFGNPDHPDQYEAIPVGETRLALVRPFFSQRLTIGLNGLIARGYTGQTTETFDPTWNIATSAAALPYCGVSSGPSGAANDFDCGTVERAVGIRMVSWVGGSISWRFGSDR